MDKGALAAWPVTVRTIGRAPHGNNNETYFVDADEDRYVLRVHHNTADAERVRDEHHLLGRLAALDLPFAIPLPARTRDGDTLAVLETAAGPRLAALFFRIPGEPAELSVANARLAGRALAQADAALGRLDLPVRSPATLRDVHPLVSDPSAALAELGLGSGSAAAAAALGRVEDAHGALTQSLPWQIIHGDFAFPNLLVDGGKVRGLVDFEFAGPDFRAADLAAALYVIAVRADDHTLWPALEAFADGYRRSLPLDPLEVAALPDLMLRRAAIGLVHWLGRWRGGLADRSEPVARVERTTRFVRWIDENAPRVALTVAGETPPTR